MKIATFGLDIQPGKYKYHCDCFDKLVEKFSPQKSSPYFVECIGENLEQGEAIVFNSSKIFDFVFIDLEKIDKRLERSEDEGEKALLKRVQALLEKEQLLCDAEFSGDEREQLNNLAFVTYKPSLACTEVQDMNQLIKDVLDKAGVLLFFTAGKKEVRVWNVHKGGSALDAAGKIHSDLARGFIKAEVVNCRDLDSFFNMAEAKAKGLVKVVDRDYQMQEGDIIEIKFNV